jgi:hypothetical protein
MKKKDIAENEKNADTRSSMTVSSETVCENEACIGKIVSGPEPSAQEADNLPENKKKRSGSAMSFGGKQGCSDEACIGKS